MNATLLLSGVLGLLAGVAVAWLLFRVSGTGPGPAPADVPEFFPERYRPLSRLLLTRDLTFLAAQEGYRPELARMLRRSRRKVLRLYLRSMRSDYNRFYAAAKRALLEFPEDRPDLAAQLAGQRLRFFYVMAIAYLELAFDAAGLATPSPHRMWPVLQALGWSARELRAG